jgi:methyl-accepting chemotaxis protein WspA
VALADGLRRMIGGLGQLITSLQASTIQIRGAVNQLNAAALENDEMGASQAAGSTEIAASSSEITETASELAATMAEVTRSAEAAASLADAGQGSLDRLDESLAQIAAASGAIVGKFGTLSERAGNIGAVVSTITRVADQTNLLSLNAAIEAEKAGEYGQGFSVIATEIRRLADQTAVAAGDIVQIVGEMQAAVSASVMGMDKFNDDVGRNIAGVRELSKILQRVIETVHQLAPRFESVNQGMQTQSQVAGQINIAIRGFSQGAATTAKLLQSTRNTTQNLDAVAAQLQMQIQRFQLA